MFLYLVRHGEPDYKRDVLLPCGWEQAELAARRLAVDGIDEIHASPMGRAQQTAQPVQTQQEGETDADAAAQESDGKCRKKRKKS